MTLTLDLTPETRQRLQDLAAASGMDLTRYVEGILEEAAAGANGASGPAADSMGDSGQFRSAESVARNRRRIELINKELEVGLDPAERAELDCLQAELDRFLAEQSPLPVGAIEALEKCAQIEGLLPRDRGRKADSSANDV